MRVLVDSSVWVDFFRRKNPKNRLPALLAEDLAVVNRLVMTELVSALKIKKDRNTISLLNLLINYDLYINWNEIIDLQTRFVRQFKNFVGIIDMIIFQNARDNDLIIYSFDRDMIRLCKLNNYTFLR
jgi:predicted nucleic acid-binding protein